ncbi:MAG: hypothetical protein GX417_11975 [Clostridiales bacterium]|nr:hypothetical protein [Clostridiales bacterium]
MRKRDPRPLQDTNEPAAARRTNGAAGPVLFKAAFVASGAAMTLLFSYSGSLLFIGAGVMLSLAICALLAFRFHLIERFLPQPKLLPMGAAAVLTGYICYLYALKFARSTNELLIKYVARAPFGVASGVIAAVLPALVALAASFTLFLWLWWFVDRSASFAARWVRTSGRAERVFLIAAWVVLAAAIAIVYRSTTAFYASSAPYDVVYTADSSQLMQSNAFFYIDAYENDIRQPLFAVFSMPFAAAAMLASQLLFFVPNAYPIVLGAVQAFLLLFGFTLLARLLETRGIEKILFLCLLVFSYPALLFTFTVEQYCFALFWVLLLVYAWHEERENRTLPFVAAAGSLLTSGAFFPLLLEKGGFAKNLRRLIAAVCAFLAFFVLFGRVPLLNSTMQTLKDISSFSGSALPLQARLLQYLNFAATCFVRPGAGVDFTTFSHVSFQLNPAESVNLLGVAVLLAAAAGAALGARKKIIRLSACWAAFSFLLLCVVGWGTSENGLVLYTLYFSWAFAILIYEFLQRLLRRWNTARIVILAALVVLLVCVNSSGMRELMRFAVTYYPAG